VASQTPESVKSHSEISAFDSYRFAIEQRVSYFPPARSQNPLKGWAGYIHSLGTLLLLQALDIFQADCLSLFH
jgi:hypothetical protein